MLVSIVAWFLYGLSKGPSVCACSLDWHSRRLPTCSFFQSRARDTAPSVSFPLTSRYWRTDRHTTIITPRACARDKVIGCVRLAILHIYIYICILYIYCILKHGTERTGRDFFIWRTLFELSHFLKGTSDVLRIPRNGRGLARSCDWPRSCPMIPDVLMERQR